MKFSEFIKLNILKRLPAIIATGVISALFSLYYIGLLDVSFIERPDGWKDNINFFSELLNGEEKKPSDELKENDPAPEKDDKEDEKAPAPNQRIKPMRKKQDDTTQPVKMDKR